MIGAPFFLLVLYLVVEYARFSFLAFMRPALIIQVVLIFYLVAKKNVVIKLFKEKYYKAYLLMLLLMILHVFIATNNYWAYMHFQRMLTYLVISLALCVFLDSLEKLILFVKFFILILALCAVGRVISVNLGGTTGQMGDPNDFALAMNVALPISYFLGRDATGWRRVFFGTALCLFVLGNVASQSRGGFLGLAAVGAVCWVHSRNKLKALIAVALLAALFWGVASPEFKEELSEIGIESAELDTGKDRIELWKVAWRAFLDNPILGVGQGNMPIVMEKYQYDATGKSYWKRGLWGRAIHSFYFTLLAELGTVGIFIMVMMLRDLIQKYKKIRELCRADGSCEQLVQIEGVTIALMTSIFGFMVTGIFLSVFYYPQFWNLAALMVAVYLSALRTSRRIPALALGGRSRATGSERKRAIR
jgi:O-antigen ligase